MKKVFMKVLMLLALGVGIPAAFAGGDVVVRDPWVQAAPPGAKVMAAYLEIANDGHEQQVLAGVSSPAFGEVSIHRSVVHGNMAHMEHLKELLVPPHASVALKPGGLHLMLMDAKKPLRAGDQVPLKLAFKDGKKIDCVAVVRSGPPESAQNHGHMDHSGHGGHKH